MNKLVVFNFEADTAEYKAKFCIGTQIVDNKNLTNDELEILLSVEYLDDFLKHGITRGIKADKLFNDIIEIGMYDDCNFMLMLEALVETEV